MQQAVLAPQQHSPNQRHPNQRRRTGCSGHRHKCRSRGVIAWLVLLAVLPPEQVRGLALAVGPLAPASCLVARRSAEEPARSSPAPYSRAAYCGAEPTRAPPP